MSVERHFIRVEKAKEFESFRRMPKYSHVPLAVINPSPRKKHSPVEPEQPAFALSASQARIALKKYEPKQIPDHLLRAPMDSFTSSPVSRKAGSRAKSSIGGSRGGKRKDSPKKGGVEGESKKIKRAEQNRKLLFLEIKKVLDKAEEAAS